MELIVRPTMEVHCHLCAFTAQHTADSPIEALIFLRRLLIEHVVDHHDQSEISDISDDAIRHITREVK